MLFVYHNYSQVEEELASFFRPVLQRLHPSANNLFVRTGRIIVQIACSPDDTDGHPLDRCFPIPLCLYTYSPVLALPSLRSLAMFYWFNDQYIRDAWQAYQHHSQKSSELVYIEATFKGEFFDYNVRLYFVLDLKSFQIAVHSTAWRFKFLTVLCTYHSHTICEKHFSHWIEITEIVFFILYNEINKRRHWYL